MPYASLSRAARSCTRSAAVPPPDRAELAVAYLSRRRREAGEQEENVPKKEGKEGVMRGVYSEGGSFMMQQLLSSRQTGAKWYEQIDGGTLGSGNDCFVEI